MSKGLEFQQLLITTAPLWEEEVWVKERSSGCSAAQHLVNPGGIRSAQTDAGDGGPAQEALHHLYLS